MPTAILPATVSLPRLTTHRSLSSARFLSGAAELGLPRPLSAGPRRFPLTLAPIRMGGGPRTYPGGVSKWQWKRMQAKKAKQLLKARLARERHLYEMRKRAELRAAVAQLERPWEDAGDVKAKAPALFSVAADEQLKALADRFQRPGGFDMWTERDGPEIFRSPADGLPSARFFPKGVVHSVRPYGVAAAGPEEAAAVGDRGEPQFDDWIARGAGGMTRRRRRRPRRSPSDRGGGGGSDGGSDRDDANLDLGSRNSSSSSSLRGRSMSKPIDVEIKDPDGLSDQFDHHLSLNSMNLMGSPEGRDGNVAWDGSSRSYGNGRRQGSRRSFGRNAEVSVATAKGERSEMVGNNRHGSSNGRFSSEKISLRPTTDLYATDSGKVTSNKNRRSKME